MNTIKYYFMKFLFTQICTYVVNYCNVKYIVYHSSQSTNFETPVVVTLHRAKIILFEQFYRERFSMDFL